MPRAEQKKRNRRKRLATALRHLLHLLRETAAPAVSQIPQPMHSAIVQLLRDLNRARIRWQEMAAEIGFSENEVQRLRSLIIQTLRELIRQAQDSDAHDLRWYRARGNAQRIPLYAPPAHGALARLLREMNQAGIPLSPLVEGMGDSKEEKEMLCAMVAQIVAPQLAGMTPANVRSRLEEADAPRHVF